MRWMVANLGKLGVTELGKHCLQGGLEGVHFLRGVHHHYDGGEDQDDDGVGGDDQDDDGGGGDDQDDQDKKEQSPRNIETSQS